MREKTVWSEPSFRGVIGIARADITPPDGIYARNWGAALHDSACGLHRPLTATAITLQADTDTGPLILLSADLGWWRDKHDEAFVRGAVLDALNVPEGNILLCLTHTHAGPSLCRADRDREGGEMVAPYLETLREKLSSLAREAVRTARPATLTVATGTCSLATNRDLPDPDAPCRFLTGFHPAAFPPDQTLLVGRITDDAGAVVGTLVNYACHPTTLGPANREISPDFVGAMREIVEAATENAPCLFLQGASGELAPREQYVGDPDVPDAHGRCLGYAVLSTLAGMLSPRQRLAFGGALASGAPLALWNRERFAPPNAPCHAELLSLSLPLRPMPSGEQIRQEMRCQVPDTTATRERLARRLQVRDYVGDGDRVSYPVWVWRVGPIAFVAHPGEAYSVLQIALRAAVPDTAVFVANVANGWYGYLPPAHLYEKELYAAKQTPLAAGCLEAMIAAVRDRLQETTV
ncbi:MAG: hypothetical protein H7145_00560 [Akkermansiaceae bacterium]|nr:hypothetical protein [Armatimonadota bacterium]